MTLLKDAFDDSYDARGFPKQQPTDAELIKLLNRPRGPHTGESIPMNDPPKRTSPLLPTDPQARKDTPIASGVLDYFPDALAEVARTSRIGNEQHNGIGTQLRWDKSKSTDESDALIRHFMERYKRDSDGVLHAAKVAWRALAFLQRLIESGNLPPG